MGNPTLILISMAILALVLSGLPSAKAAEVVAGHGIPAKRSAPESDSATWRFSDPTPKDTISWTSGVNKTDGVLHDQNAFGPEGKFAFFPPPPPLFGGRTFTGFTDNDGPGPGGSKTSTSGSGSSAFVPGTIWGTNAKATWTVTATGDLGNPFADPITGDPRRPSWESRATGDDPFSITPAQLADITEPFYDLFFVAGLIGGSYSPLGGLGLTASYETASGVTVVLNIALDETGASVTSDIASDLSLYLLTSLDEGPTQIPANLTSLSAIQSLLNSDVASDRTIDFPLFLGIILDDVAVPTVDLGDGSVARIHIGSNVFDGAVGIPEPSTLMLFLSGLGPWVALLLHRRRKREANPK